MSFLGYGYRQLPDTGTLAYNGVQFDPLYHTTLSGTVIRDSADRGVKYVEWSLTVEGFVTAANLTTAGGIAAVFRGMRQALTAVGKRLQYQGKGFDPGGIDVNGPGPYSPATGVVGDVAWGPKPELLEFTPLGNSMAARVVWKVTFRIPECGTAQYTNTMLQWTWSSSIGFGDDGYCHYTVQGNIEIALNYRKVGGQQFNGASLSVEQWRQLTDPRPPIGFRPTSRSRQFTEDKRTLTWTYTFEEIPPMGMPLYTMKAGGNYSVRNNNKNVLAANIWTASLRANYTIRADYPRREAYRRFLLLLNERMMASRLGVIQRTITEDVRIPPAPNAGQDPAGYQAWLQMLRTLTANQDSAQITAPGTVGFNGVLRVNRTVYDQGRAIMTNFGFDEGLYLDSKSVSFEASWTLMCTFESIMAGSGIWRKIRELTASGNFSQNYEADRWAITMANVIGYKSWKDFAFNADQDAVIDACLTNPAPDLPPASNTETPPLDEWGSGHFPRSPTRLPGWQGWNSNPQTQEQWSGGGWSPMDDEGNDRRRPPLDPSAENALLLGITAETSWLGYECNLKVLLKPGTARHKILPQTPLIPDKLSSIDVLAPQPGQEIVKGVNLASNSSQADYVQQVATPTYTVRVSGAAIRAGFQIPVPGLVSFGGVTPVPGRQAVSGPRIIANYGGIPVYALAWELDYIIPVPPKQAQAAPPNLAQHVGQVSQFPTGIKLPVSIPEPGEPDYFGNAPPSPFLFTGFVTE